MIYISSPNDVSLDQELENVLVGPVSAGTYKFVLEVMLVGEMGGIEGVRCVTGRWTGWDKGAIG